jgi:hypothetical protein
LSYYTDLIISFQEQGTTMATDVDSDDAHEKSEITSFMA